MRIVLGLVLISILLACSIEQSQLKIPDTALYPKDTTILYDLEGISSEGAEAAVRYINGHIYKSEIGIYGDMGRTEIIYEFTGKRIKVTEKNFLYEKYITEIKSEKDIKLTKEFSYFIDLNGIPLEKINFERTDIYKEFIHVVPFILK